METNEQIFTPRRLYIKRHSVTNMRYFGQTVSEDVEKYKGSGTYWIRHIKKHGVKNVVTEWTSDWFYEPETISEFALSFSEEYDIVNSSEWANLIPEDGLDGWSGFNGIRGQYDEDLAIIRMKENGTYDGWIEKLTIASTGENNPSYDKQWYHNPNTTNLNGLFFQDEIPEGWVKGMCFDVKQKMIISNYGKNAANLFFHNPDTLETRRFKNGENVPEGWLRGFGMDEEQIKKRSESHSGENNPLTGTNPYYNYETETIRYFKPDEVEEGFVAGIPSTQYDSIRGEGSPFYSTEWYHNKETNHEHRFTLEEIQNLVGYEKGRLPFTDEYRQKLKNARANSKINYTGWAQIVNINDSKEIKWFDVSNEYELPEGYKFRNNKNASKLKKRETITN
jgi:hypothetical protein